jgi:hypothetical protein
MTNARNVYNNLPIDPNTLIFAGVKGGSIPIGNGAETGLLQTQLYRQTDSHLLQY